MKASSIDNETTRTPPDQSNDMESPESPESPGEPARHRHASQRAVESHFPYIEELRRLGVRVTPQRLFVLDALEHGGGHMTAEEIMQWAVQRYPALNLATVYRTLDLLIEVGLVAQMRLDSGVTTFELVGSSPHHHLICEHCGAIIELDNSVFEALNTQLLAQYGFQARPRHLALFGLCRGCAAAQQSASSS